MGFRDDIRTIDTPPVDDHRPVLPAMWWYNGVKNARTPGVFYIKADALSATPSEPWQPSARFEGEEGFETETLHLLPICYRQQPYRTVTVGTGAQQRRERQYLTEWVLGAQFHTELLCIVAGIEEPVVWSCHGMTSRALTGKGGIFAVYRTGLLKEAEKVAGKKVPPWTFWLPIATQRDAMGRVIYTDTGHGSFVTPPALALPDKPLADLLDELFAGKEWVEYGYELYRQFEDWRNERRGVTGPTPAPNGAAAPAARAATPPAAEDEDLPF